MRTYDEPQAWSWWKKTCTSVSWLVINTFFFFIRMRLIIFHFLWTVNLSFPTLMCGLKARPLASHIKGKERTVQRYEMKEFNKRLCPPQGRSLHFIFHFIIVLHLWPHHNKEKEWAKDWWRTIWWKMMMAFSGRTFFSFNAFAGRRPQLSAGKRSH